MKKLPFWPEIGHFSAYWPSGDRFYLYLTISAINSLTRSSGIANFFDLTMIALHSASIQELVEGSNAQLVGNDVEVSKGCSFCYFWNHPFHATRISMRLGVFSIGLALLSILLTLILFGCCN